MIHAMDVVRSVLRETQQGGELAGMDVVGATRCELYRMTDGFSSRLFFSQMPAGLEAAVVAFPGRGFTIDVRPEDVQPMVHAWLAAVAASFSSVSLPAGRASVQRARVVMELVA